MKNQKYLWIVIAVAIVLVVGCAIGLIVSKGNQTKPIIVDPIESTSGTESVVTDVPVIVDDNKTETDKRIRGEIDIDVAEIAKKNAPNPEPAVDGDVFVIVVKGENDE